MGLHSHRSHGGGGTVGHRGVLRSDGPLSEEDLTEARRAGIALRFDPLQAGWVRADCLDDIAPNIRRAGWPDIARSVPGAPSFDLRHWAEDDVAEFRRLLDNPNVWAYLPAPYPGTITDETASQLIALSGDAGLHKVRAIIVKGRPVGQVRLEHKAPHPELSYWLGEPFWGQGIGSTAVSAFADQCFEEDQTLTRMIARVLPQNAASRKILEKSGFVTDGGVADDAGWITLRRDRSD